MATTHTIDGSIADWVPGVDPRRVRAVAYLNIPATEVVVEDSGKVWTASKAVDIDTALGTFAAELLATDATDLNVEPDTLQWSIQLSVVDQQTRLVGRTPQADRRTVTLGPFPVTTDGSIGDLTEHFDSPAVSPQWRSTFRDEMEGIEDSVAADRTAVATDRAYVENLVVTDLGTTDGQTKALIESPTSETAGALNAAYAQGVNVTAHGAKGDGTTLASLAFNAAIIAANGRTIHVPAGTYLLNNVVIPAGKVARFKLDQGARLVHEGGSHNNAMFNFQGDHLRIRGGTIDGNRANQTGRPMIVSGQVLSGQSIDIEDVHFTGTVHACVRINTFGGYFNFSHNHVTDQAQHTGSGSAFTTVATVVAGQEGAKGFIRTNHNRCIFTATPDRDGSNPGGFFVATNGYDMAGGGAPGSAGFGNGNQSTWEAIGNHFEGYGQHDSVNDISPLHTYPTIAGARWVGNYFSGCAFSAVSAKSVQDFVFTDNVIVDGVVSTKNTASEGAIAYLPGYQASTFARPRAVIANNIVRNPGGQPTIGQAGIVINGTAASNAADVIVANNVIEGTGWGLQAQYAKDITISGNQIKLSTGTATGPTGRGIEVSSLSGDIRILNNRIETTNGDGIRAIAGVSTASFFVEGNVVRQKTLASAYGVIMRGMDRLTVRNNMIDATGPAINVQSDGTNNVGTLVYDRSNTIVAGAVTLNWAQIGTFIGQSPPQGAPTAVVGAAAGAGATITVTGDGDSGTISVVTGGPTTAGGFATLTFPAVRRRVPRAIMLTPANGLARVSSIFVNAPSTTVNSFALSAQTATTGFATHTWYYQIIE